MDIVNITLQNEKLIEQLINSSDELRVRISNAIVDSIAKRTAKKVLANADEALKKALDRVEMEVSHKFLEYSDSGWRQQYALKEEYKREIRNAVNDIWQAKIYESIDEVKQDIMDRYKLRLESSCDAYIRKLDDAIEHIDDKISAAVEKYFTNRLK